MNRLVVVTPAYNCEKTIERTLFSIAGQTYKNWKMIIIDDMSTDKTRNVIQDFVDRNKLNDKLSLEKKSLEKLEILGMFATDWI